MSQGPTSSDRSPPGQRVSFIVPAFNAGTTLRACIESVRAAAPAGAEVVVVDDGSFDDTREIAESVADFVIHRPCQAGAARARNDACRRAGGDVFVFVDADVTVDGPAVSALLAHLATGADAAFGAYQPLPPPDKRNPATDYKNLLQHYTHTIGATERAATFWSGFGAITREALFAVDGFDPATTRSADVEDIHLGYRLNAAGFRVVLDPRQQVTHHKQYRVVSALLSDVFHRAIPWAKAMVELSTYSPDLNLQHRSIAGAVLVWSALASLALTPVLGPATLLATAVAMAGWLVVNRAFLRYVYSVAGVRTATTTAALHALFGIYAPVGAMLGLGFAFLRRPSRSVRNTLDLTLLARLAGEPGTVDVTVAVIDGDDDAADAAFLHHAWPATSWWEMLVVTPRPELFTHLPGVRVIGAPTEADADALADLALRAARGRMLALVDADLVPTPAWLDHVRSAARRGDLAVGGSFAPDRTGVLHRASSLAWWWAWRPQVAPIWMENHARTNVAYDVLAARRVGGFDEPGALLRRLSAFGARPLRFDPGMLVTVEPGHTRRRLRALYDDGRTEASALVRYYDNSRRLRLARVALVPLWILLAPLRFSYRAVRERTADRVFWCALPAATFGATCRYLGRAMGYLRPGRHRFGTSEPPVFAELMETTVAS